MRHALVVSKDRSVEEAINTLLWDTPAAEIIQITDCSEGLLVVYDVPTYTDYQETIGATAVQLTAHACMEVAIQADPTNTSTITLGGETARYWALAAGAAIVLDIDNTNKLWAIAGGAGQLLNLKVHT